MKPITAGILGTARCLIQCGHLGPPDVGVGGNMRVLDC